ncbi:vomeronasal type-1 receptor 48-like [Perognathus longimembris pacificus]|uniref:vomeronasal type-1 receptor 48-like n=1 Tax=Perognathus longimembris pacificus TaxID=214514 RepID=UPI002019EC8B|nr:vomeronasal type-1 receptor 48-like [Perognathus longimembris pacificus]
MTKNKLYHNAAVRSAFFSEVAIGILANTILLLFHIFIFLHEHRPNPTDLPVGLLALTHLAMLIIMGFIGTDIFMSWERFWDTITCKWLVYLHRLVRGLTVCITCLLSVLQAVTLSPRSSCLAKLKRTSPRHYLCSLLVLWVLYMSVSSHIFMSVIATPNLTSDSLIYVTESCSVLPISYTLRQVFSTFLTVREFFLMGLTFVSNGYMVTVLCIHKRETQHLHSSSLALKTSPEQRATRTILLLTSFFMVMSILDYGISASRIMWNNDPALYCVIILISHSYAAVSALVFISTDKRVIIFVRTMWGRTVTVYSGKDIFSTSGMNWL